MSEDKKHSEEGCEHPFHDHDHNDFNNGPFCKYKALGL